MTAHIDQTATPIAIIRELLLRAGYELDTPRFADAERTLVALDVAAVARAPVDWGELLATIEPEIKRARMMIRQAHYRGYQKAAQSLQLRAMTFAERSPHRALWLSMAAAAVTCSIRDDPFKPKHYRLR